MQAQEHAYRSVESIQGTEPLSASGIQTQKREPLQLGLGGTRMPVGNAYPPNGFTAEGLAAKGYATEPSRVTNEGTTGDGDQGDKYAYADAELTTARMQATDAVENAPSTPIKPQAKGSSLDYMFVLMSNEMFTKHYSFSKVFVKGRKQTYEQRMAAAQEEQNLKRGPAPGGVGTSSPVPTQSSKASMLSPPMTRREGATMGPDLDGLVSVKPIERQYTNEVPTVTCHLLPTHRDFLKVLVCDEDLERAAKLTQDAADRLEMEKQTQVKQYMEDIISKLSCKDRKHKVTVKRKFLDEAIDLEAQGAPSEGRAAQVFVIVVNREKDYDPVISQKMSLKLLKEKRPRGVGS